MAFGSPRPWGSLAPWGSPGRYVRPSAPAGPATLREAVYARLAATAALTAIVADAIHLDHLPQGLHGPSVCVSIPARGYGHVLRGSDGRSSARVQVSCRSTKLSEAVAMAEAVRARFQGFRGLVGLVRIHSCLLVDEAGLREPPEDGSDEWTYHVACDYRVSHRVPLPSLLGA